ncbi:MAG: ABC transporter substrate-binding protein [Deltaproteobacteria bacterium]|nr:ABC transporter substrate-binding protein [Deltaproteobacteria bacterium]
MERFKKKIIMLFLFLSCFLVCGGEVFCVQEKTALRVGYLPLLSQTPLVVSYENDRLNFQNISPELVRYNSFTALEAAMRVGAVDVASLPLAIVLDMASEGHKIKIIGTCSSGGSRLVARKKGGLETIRGSLIGVPGHDSNENLTLSQVLGTMNLRQGLEYKTIGVTFNRAVDNFKVEKLDALYLPEPFGTIAERENIAHEIQGQEGKLTGTLGTVLVIRSEILEKYEQGAKEWLISLVKSCRFIENDVKQSGARQTAIIQTSYFQFPEAVVIEALVNHKGELKFDQFVPDQKKIKNYMDLASKMKILTKSVDLNALLSLNLIKKAGE